MSESKMDIEAIRARCEKNKADPYTPSHVRRILGRDVPALLDEVERLRAERLALAKLAHPEPQFFNPLDAWAAKALRDRVLSESYSRLPSGDTKGEV